MGNVIELPNITLESLVVTEDKNSNEKKGNGFDAKNYLNTRLADGELEKTLTIRLLPMDLETGNPFVIVHTHNVKVPQEMVKPGEKPYKSYICLSKTKGIDHEKFGSRCPFCEINRDAYNESKKATDPLIAKNWQDISIANLSREAVICRCIERGKESEGVKFWKFNIRSDKTDPYNQILKLVSLRSAAAAKKGTVENILDIYNGRDLNVTITAEGTSAPQIVDDSDRSPLSSDEELMKKWIYDPKKWQDVFTCKPYEYLNLVSQSKVPWFDRDQNAWVDKEEYDAVHGDKTKKDDSDIAKANEAIAQVAQQAETKREAEKAEFINNLTVKEEDLPF